MRIRRLKILGIALGLSALSAIVGVIFFVVPKGTFTPVNRVEDYVVVNDALFWARRQPWIAAHADFPKIDAENQHLRFVAIDEPSLLPPPQGFGQFPWDRHLYGEMLQRFHKAGAKIVTFDVLFLEPSASAGADATFAAGMRTQPTVLGFEVNTAGGNFNLLTPPPILTKAANALGFTTVDNPGGWLVGQYFTMTDKEPAFTHTFPSLAAATVEAYTGEQIEPVDNWHARFGKETIPLDGDGQFLMLPFSTYEQVGLGTGSGGDTRAGTTDLSVPFLDYQSAATVMSWDDATLKAYMNGNIVVIGPTAQGLGDFILTPNGRYPGVFANMRLMDQLMTGKFIRRVPPWIDIFLILLVPLLVGFVVTQLRATVGVGIAVGVVVLYSIAVVALYAYTLRWADLIHVDGATIFAALFVALYRTITEGADKRVITQMFGKHVSPALVQEMLKHDDPLKALDLSGKRVKVTIFYSDIRGFTAMSEKMSPEQIYGNLNEYFEEMCRIVFEHGGYVDKFIGDCLMAVFSAPNPRPGNEDAYHAVLSAWEQQQKILEMMTEWTAADRKTFTVGMGLNTGEVVMGNLGSSDRLNYTVIGDNVNTAARLYNVAKGGQIIISESTYEEVKDRFIVNELTPVSVKGKMLPLRNFEIVGRLEPGAVNTSTLLDPDNLPEAAVAADH